MRFRPIPRIESILRLYFGGGWAAGARLVYDSEYRPEYLYTTSLMCAVC